MRNTKYGKIKSFLFETLLSLFSLVLIFLSSWLNEPSVRDPQDLTINVEALETFIQKDREKKEKRLKEEKDFKKGQERKEKKTTIENKDIEKAEENEKKGIKCEEKTKHSMESSEDDQITERQSLSPEYIFQLQIPDASLNSTSPLSTSIPRISITPTLEIKIQDEKLKVNFFHLFFFSVSFFSKDFFVLCPCSLSHYFLILYRLHKNWKDINLKESKSLFSAILFFSFLGKEKEVIKRKKAMKNKKKKKETKKRKQPKRKSLSSFSHHVEYVI